MEPYRWVHLLKRLADNIGYAVPLILKIADAVEMLLVRVIVFVGFLYGIHGIYARGHKDSSSSDALPLRKPPRFDAPHHR